MAAWPHGKACMGIRCFSTMHLAMQISSHIPGEVLVGLHEDSRAKLLGPGTLRTTAPVCAGSVVFSICKARQTPATNESLAFALLGIRYHNGPDGLTPICLRHLLGAHLKLHGPETQEISS